MGFVFKEFLLSVAMLSDRVFVFLRLTVPLLFFTGVLRHNWNWKIRQFYKPSGRNFMVYFNLANLLLTATFHIVQTIRFYRSNDFHSLNILFPFTTGTLNICLVNGILIYDPDSVCESFNFALVFLNRIQSNNKHSKYFYDNYVLNK